VTTILSFVFVLGVLIFVHELGHFLMARRLGVRVLTFSLGFGPKLLSFRRGDTEYCISAIPLGGYVKMAGETVEDTRTGAADEFLSKSKWQRFQVLIMGPVMNIALAVVLAAIVLYQGVDVPLFESQPVVVGSVVSDSPASAAGIAAGDRILAVDGVAVETWKQFGDVLAKNPGGSVDLRIDRQGRIEQKPIVTKGGTSGVGLIGLLPPGRPQVLAITAGNPAAEAGLRPRDIVVAVAGEAGPTYPRVRELIAAHEDRPLPVEVERNGNRVSLVMTPRKIEGEARIGAVFSPFELRTVPPGALGAIGLAVQRNWEASGLIIRTLGGLFTGQTSVGQLAGPVAIARESGSAATQGWIALLTLMAVISLNLGLINLMPIPVLDGGHIAILALEGVSRRDFSIATKERMLLVGFALLVLLMVTVIYNDLTRIAWIQRAMPWR
jgi:regulator of sigma E protease